MIEERIALPCSGMNSVPSGLLASPLNTNSFPGRSDALGDLVVDGPFFRSIPETIQTIVEA